MPKNDTYMNTQTQLTSRKTMSHAHAFNIPGATPKWLSQYPSYLVSLTGNQIEEMFLAGVLDIDPDYQRGRTTATAKHPSQPVQTRLRNRRHIRELYGQLASVTPTGRTYACWTPISLNARRTNEHNSKVFYNPKTSVLSVGGDRKLFAFDGWHRVLAILAAIRDKVIQPEWTFDFYIFDAPVAFEAQKFNTFNTGGMPVKKSRTAFVSGRYSEDRSRLAADFINSNPHLKAIINGQELYNLENVEGTTNKNTAVLAPYIVIHNGFVTAPSSSVQLWPSTEIDTTSPSDRALVTNYMNNYWNEIVQLLPELGFADIETRQAQRIAKPLLLNPVTIQNLVWLGHQLLVSYKPVRGTSYRSKLRELKNPLNRQALFEKLRPLGHGISVGKNKTVPFFNMDNPLWSGDIQTSGSLFRNDIITRRRVFEKIVKALGVDQPNSVSAPLTRTNRTKKAFIVV